jgi:hypothetical protein
MERFLPDDGTESPRGAAHPSRPEISTKSSVRSGPGRLADPRASATVEQTGLVLMIAAALARLLAYSLPAGDAGPGRELGNRTANRIACGPRALDACHHHPAVEVYGWPLARLLTRLAPVPAAQTGPDGRPLVPVDFRYCRRPSCAVPAAGERGLRLTASNRRITAFTEVNDQRSGGGGVDLTWWLYRPGLGWQAIRRKVGPAEIEAASGTRVRLADTPVLVPLETLDGRNHVSFPADEQPPWQWRVGSIHGPRAR